MEIITLNEFRLCKCELNAWFPHRLLAHKTFKAGKLIRSSKYESYILHEHSMLKWTVERI